ncbi:hypothetical protein RFI_31957, partial [Reticulomyxa filosa]
MADEQVLNKTLQSGFYHLKFSHLIDAPFALSNLFGMQDPKWTKVQSVMIQRLQWTIQETIPTDDVLCEVNESFQQNLNALHRYNLVKEYQNVVDYVVTVGWTRVLLSFYDNCYFKVVFIIITIIFKNWKVLLQAINDKNESMQQMKQIFLSSAMTKIIPLFGASGVLEKHAHLYCPTMRYEAQFPFSWNFHVWCFDKISNTMKLPLPSGNMTHVQQDKIVISSNEDVEESANRLKDILQTRNEPFTLLNKCNPQSCEYYTKDVIRGKYHMYIKLKGDDQLCACIKGIVFCMVWLVSGKNNRIHIPMIES